MILRGGALWNRRIFWVLVQHSTRFMLNAVIGVDDYCFFGCLLNTFGWVLREAWQVKRCLELWLLIITDKYLFGICHRIDFTIFNGNYFIFGVHWDILLFSEVVSVWIILTVVFCKTITWIHAGKWSYFGQGSERLTEFLPCLKHRHVTQWKLFILKVVFGHRGKLWWLQLNQWLSICKWFEPIHQCAMSSKCSWAGGLRTIFILSQRCQDSPFSIRTPFALIVFLYNLSNFFYTLNSFSDIFLFALYCL